MSSSRPSPIQTTRATNSSNSPSSPVQSPNSRMNQAVDLFMAAANSFQEKRYSEAIETFSRCISLTPRPSDDNYASLEVLVKAHLSRGICYHSVRKMDDACKDFEANISLYEKYNRSETFQNSPSLISSTMKAHYMNGKCLDALKRTKEAVDHFSKAIDLGISVNERLAQENEPCHSITPYYLSRANAYDSLSQYELAVKDFSQFIELYKEDLKSVVELSDDQRVNSTSLYSAYHNRGYANLALSNHDQALADFDLAVKEFEKAKDKPSTIKSNAVVLDTIYQRGKLHERFEKLDKAIDDYDMVLKYNDNHTKCHFMRGNLMYYHRRDYREAKRSFDKVIAKDPSDWQSTFNRGQCLKCLSMWDKAIADFKTTIKLNPKFHKGYVELARALQTSNPTKKDQNKQLIELYSKAIDIAKQQDGLLSETELSALYFDRAVVYASSKQQDDQDSAISDLSESIRYKPDNNHDAYYNRSLLLHGQKRYEEALADCDKVLSITPDDHGMLCDKGYILSHLERFTDAIQIFDQILAKDNTNHLATRGKEYCESMMSQ